MRVKTPIRWGIIGCGAVTEVKSGPAYQQVAGFELSAVMRRNEKLAKEYAHRHGVEKYCTNAEELIADKSIDALYIATPPDTHKQYGVMVANAGKPCCIEKPLAPSFEDARDIVDAFEHAKTPLFVAYYRRSLPRFAEIKKNLALGVIGATRHIQWQLNRQVSDKDLAGERHWRTDAQVAPGGYFDDLACHGLDLFAHLLGDYEHASGHSASQQQLYTAKDAVVASWIHTNGVTGSGCWNFASASRKDDVVITGSEGEIQFSVFEEQAIHIRNASGEQSINIANPTNIQLHHVQNMHEQLVNSVPHPSTGTTALHTNWVMHSILSA
ncbi:MAG: Gfo/Idh/MocA family oxidoreductase [Pseudomonadota bacterium]